MYTRTPLDVVPTTRRHLDSEPLRTAHARTLCIATDTGATITEARRALALGLRILRAQRNHYRQSRPAWACWCGMDTPLRKTDQCADHAPSGAYTSDRW